MDYRFNYNNKESGLSWSCIVVFDDRFHHALFVNFLILIVDKFPYLELSLSQIEG